MYKGNKKDLQFKGWVIEYRNEIVGNIHETEEEAKYFANRLRKRIFGYERSIIPCNLAMKRVWVEGGLQD